MLFCIIITGVMIVANFYPAVAAVAHPPNQIHAYNVFSAELFSVLSRKTMHKVKDYLHFEFLVSTP
jgi:hypothetical protein